MLWGAPTALVYIHVMIRVGVYGQTPLLLCICTAGSFPNINEGRTSYDCGGLPSVSILQIASLRHSAMPKLLV
jgi:hypothetical protein